MAFFVGALGILLGQWPLAEVVWLGANLGEIVTVFSAIGLVVPLPLLFVTSVVALRQLERVRPVGEALSQMPRIPVAVVGPAPQRDLTQTERFAIYPPMSIAEHTTLRAAVVAFETEDDDLPDTRPN